VVIGRPKRKADLTAICEPTVEEMWEPRRLTTLWGSRALALPFILRSPTDNYHWFLADPATLECDVAMCMACWSFKIDARTIIHCSLLLPP
jgi:hypothetical protein